MLKKIYSSIICFGIFIFSTNFAYGAYWEDTKNDTGFSVYIDSDSIYKYQDSYVYTIKYVKEGKSTYTQIELKPMKNQYNLAAILSVDDKYKDIYEIPQEREYKRVTSDQAIYNSTKIVLNKYFVSPCQQSKCVAINTNPYVESSNSSPGIDTEDGPDFGPYMRVLQRRIKMNWDPPKGSESKHVVLLFKVAKDGRLLACSVYKSSGVQEADQAALRAVRQTAPFRPLPSKYKHPSVDIQFTFDYNVIQDGPKVYNQNF